MRITVEDEPVASFDGCRHRHPVGPVRGVEVMGLEDFMVAQARKHPRLADLITKVARRTSPDQVILLNYPVDSRPRWNEEHPHQVLYELIDRHRATYQSHLRSFLGYADGLAKIAARPSEQLRSTEPHWINGWLPALDAVSLYCFIALNQPKYYVEIGSGNSTKFARRAIADHGLKTRIMSIDPHPRAEINSICDESIRKPAENVDLDVFDVLDANDILFIDCSHRVYMNSDTTALFLDVIPRLKPGVLVQVHDVTLPYDYPKAWSDRYYSEQYLLAAYLLARGTTLDIVLPCMFISVDPELKHILSPLWSREPMIDVETHGGSFWLRTK